MLSIRFDTWCDRTQWGDRVFVVGSWNNWEVPSAIELFTDEFNFPRWTSQAQVDARRCEVIEYKYIILKVDGTIEWETLGGPNREMVAWDHSLADDTFGIIVEKVLAFPCTTGFHERIRVMLEEKSKRKLEVLETDSQSQLFGGTCSEELVMKKTSEENQEFECGDVRRRQKLSRRRVRFCDENWVDVHESKIMQRLPVVNWEC